MVGAHGLSCPAACVIFPDQGLNLRPLHWQVDPRLSFLPQADWPHISTYLPPSPHQLRSSFCLEVLFPLIGTCLDSPDSVDGTGGRPRVPSIDRCLPGGSWGVRGPDPVVGDSRTD